MRHEIFFPWYLHLDAGLYKSEVESPIPMNFHDHVTDAVQILVPRVPSMATKVKVTARLRPFINTENPDDAVIVSSSEGSISIANPRNTNERFKFSFTSCYDQSASQEEIFEIDVRPLITHVFNGLEYVTRILCLATNSSVASSCMHPLKSIAICPVSLMMTLFS